METTEPRSPIRRLRTKLALASVVAVLASLVPATAAWADPPHNLPENANGYELTFSPAFDYDTDGCYQTPAIGPDGTLNPGLNTSGAVNGSCHDKSDLDNSQTYSRSKCNNGWCAIVYAGYFEKDQTVNGCCGHRHDFEHVISWVNQASNQIEYVSNTVHSSVETHPRSEVRFDGTHPKIVYHKDGCCNTHYYRLANSNDEPPENWYHTWRYPPLVGWDGWPSIPLRDELMNADFGSATIKINPGRFEDLLTASKPAGIPFDPRA
jgi:hypothetical protein